MQTELLKETTTEDQSSLFMLERELERKKVIKFVALFGIQVAVAYFAFSAIQYLWLLLTCSC